MKHNKPIVSALFALSGLCLAALSSCNGNPPASSSSGGNSSLSESSAVSSSAPFSDTGSSSFATDEGSSLPSLPSSSGSESSSNANTVAVHFDTGDESIVLEDVLVEEGGLLEKPYPERDGYALRRWMLDGQEFDFSTPIDHAITLVAEWVERTNLPTMMIELRDEGKEVIPLENVTRDEYVLSAISLVGKEGHFDLKDAASSFKGRGNASWIGNKKGYKIKFDKKQSLFGREANKHWVLLACTNFNDTTMLRNYTAYNMAGALFSKLEYTTNAVWMDLFVNGEYRGVYVLCEHVRVGKGRVNISSKYGVEDTGYLLEYDAYAKGTEGIDYFDITDSNLKDDDPGGPGPNPPGGDNPPGGGDNPFPGGGSDPFGGVYISTHPHGGIVRYDFTIHSPDPEDFESDGQISEEQWRAQVSFIKDYVKQVYTCAIVDQNFASFSALADVDSLVDLYILNELYKNTDAGYSSFFMYKKPGGKLFFGPAWDFDGTTTAARGEENNPLGIYVADTVRNNQVSSASELLLSLYQVPEFRAAVETRFAALSSGISAYYQGVFNESFYAENRFALGKNFVRWGSGSPMPGGSSSALTQEKAESDWVNNCNTLFDWFNRRIAFLNEEWKAE